uniref:Uncharacterized protein n=1 Tax=Proboscia inermis TaxID=420281 RepID=A0A7S0C677_9STRA
MVPVSDCEDGGGRARLIISTDSNLSLVSINSRVWLSERTLLFPSCKSLVMFAFSIVVGTRDGEIVRYGSDTDPTPHLRSEEYRDVDSSCGTLHHWMNKFLNSRTLLCSFFSLGRALSKCCGILLR